VNALRKDGLASKNDGSILVKRHSSFLRSANWTSRQLESSPGAPSHWALPPHHEEELGFSKLELGFQCHGSAALLDDFGFLQGPSRERKQPRKSKLEVRRPNLISVIKRVLQAVSTPQPTGLSGLVVYGKLTQMRSST